MSALDDLAPDQRAVLQMVLQRGRSYDEIAGLLSIERAAVRQRALDAFDALAPTTVLPGPERALVTDYLLRQLPERVAEQVHEFLLASEADRAWAQALAQVIAPLTPAALPEIPVGAPLGADDLSPGGLEPDSDPPMAEPSEPAHEPLGAAHEPFEPAPEPRAREPRAREPRTSAPRPHEPRRSSRRGGAVLLGTIGVVIVAVIVVVIASSGGGAKAPASSAQTIAHHSTTQTTSTSTTQTTSTSTTATTGTSTTVTKQTVLAQLNLKSPSGAKSPLGIAQIERVDGILGIVIYATGVPANTAHNAYAMWMYNSPTSYRFVGFVSTLVGKSGILATDGKLKPWVASYHRMLITLETQPKPKSPGEVVLSSPFHE